MTNRSRRKRLAVVASGLVGLAFVVAGCGPANGQNSLLPKGTQAKEINDLIVPIFGVAIVVAILVGVATVYCAVRFRARPGIDDRPRQVHGNPPLEIAWTLIPAVILAVIAVPTVSLIFKLNEAPKPNALEVTAVGKQWWWQFDYKDQGVKTVVVADEFHVPVGRQVHMTLTGCDPSLGTTPPTGDCNVIHSFWVPELNGKRDVIPGHLNTTTFTADKPGTYLGQCAEYCGLSHANMRFRVIAQSESDFQAWLAGQHEGPAITIEQAGEGGKLFAQKYACTNCHAAEDSSVSSYGPNLTHLASRSTFASGYYKLTRANLVDWIYNAPSMIPMESKDCRLPVGQGICVGMPSFSQNTPAGQPTMTRAEAETIADYLLQLK